MVQGGNDYEIAVDNKITKAITVTGPSDTIEKVKKVIKEDLELNIYDN